MCSANPERLRALAACRKAAPHVDILTFNPTGPVLAVRPFCPFCPSGDYWQVYFDTNRAISRFLAGGLDRSQESSAG